MVWLDRAVTVMVEAWERLRCYSCEGPLSRLRLFSYSLPIWDVHITKRFSRNLKTGCCTIVWLQGIYDTLKTCANISKSAGGIGVAVHCIRASGSYIAGVSVPLDIQPVSTIHQHITNTLGMKISVMSFDLFLCPDNMSLKSGSTVYSTSSLIQS